MLKNVMESKSYDEVQEILKLTPSDIHVVEIDGELIQTWEEYSLEIEAKMQFPTTCIDNIDRYLDWIRDLEWLGKRGYMIVFYNFSKLMRDNSKIKKMILEDFKDIILPWWQNDVENHVPYMKKSPFNVYLVD